MMARLGDVIYWIACGLAVLVFVVIIATAPSEDRIYAWIGAAFIALIIWAIGRGIQYIFGGGQP